VTRRAGCLDRVPGRRGRRGDERGTAGQVEGGVDTRRRRARAVIDDEGAPRPARSGPRRSASERRGDAVSRPSDEQTPLGLEGTTSRFRCGGGLQRRAARRRSRPALVDPSRMVGPSGAMATAPATSSTAGTATTTPWSSPAVAAWVRKRASGTGRTPPFAAIIGLRSSLRPARPPRLPAARVAPQPAAVAGAGSSRTIPPPGRDGRLDRGGGSRRPRPFGDGRGRPDGADRRKRSSRRDRTVPRVASPARDLGTNRQTVQRIVTELHREGLVTFGPDPHDRRAQQGVLTEKGEQSHAAAMRLPDPAVSALAAAPAIDGIRTAARVPTGLRARLEGTGNAAEAT